MAITFKAGQRGLVVRTEPPGNHVLEPMRLLPCGTFGQRHLFGVAQFEGKLSRGRIAAVRLHIETAQDDLLQVIGDILADQAGRSRGLVEPPDQGFRGVFRVAERALAGCQRVEQHAEREDVAARFLAQFQHLFGRDVGRGAHRHAEFLREQIRQL